MCFVDQAPFDPLGKPDKFYINVEVSIWFPPSFVHAFPFLAILCAIILRALTHPTSLFPIPSLILFRAARVFFYLPVPCSALFSHSLLYYPILQPTYPTLPLFSHLSCSSLCFPVVTFPSFFTLPRPAHFIRVCPYFLPIYTVMLVFPTPPNAVKPVSSNPALPNFLLLVQ